MKSIEALIHEKCLSQGKTLALAESCTGGYVAHRLTLQPGASTYFLGGIVCYSNRSKIDLLSIDPLVIEGEGAVSESVVRQMAEGAIQIFHSDFSLAITGIAGPTGGSPQKPIGTAFLAIGIKGKPTQVWKTVIPSLSRQEIIKSLTDDLLTHFIQILA